jgi:hypothetical protein
LPVALSGTLHKSLVRWCSLGTLHVSMLPPGSVVHGRLLRHPGSVRHHSCVKVLVLLPTLCLRIAFTVQPTLLARWSQSRLCVSLLIECRDLLEHLHQLTFTLLGFLSGRNQRWHLRITCLVFVGVTGLVCPEMLHVALYNFLSIDLRSANKVARLDYLLREVLWVQSFLKLPYLNVHLRCEKLEFLTKC